MNKKQIKKALDLFEDEKYSDAKDILRVEIHDVKAKWLQKKLNLKEGPAW